MMPTEELLAFIGHSPSAPDLDAWLTSHRIRNRPFKAEADEHYRRDPFQADKNSRASQVDEVERHSLALIYDTRDVYESLVGPTAGEPGDFVLREVAFFAKGMQHYRGYQGELPFGLTFGESLQDSVRRRGEPLAVRTVQELRSALWAPDGWILNASYFDGDSDLGVVHIRRQNLYDRRMLGLDSVPSDDRRKADTIGLEGLGQPAQSETVVRALRAIGFDPSDFDFSQEGELTNFVHSHGVTLYLGGRGREVSALTGLRFGRKGDMRSEGYEGRLPFGIEFHDTPLVLESKVGRRPDKVSQAPDTGAFLWNLEGYELHVMFSLIDFQVYRVTVFVSD